MVLPIEPPEPRERIRAGENTRAIFALGNQFALSLHEIRFQVLARGIHSIRFMCCQGKVQSQKSAVI